MSAEEFLPEHRSMAALKEAAADCQGCSLYRNATQTVFGEGPRSAEVIMVGEQPGDREDLAGKPFVGPAGSLLSEALEEAGIDRREVYVTNAVKHFKFERRGKRRIHRRPAAEEIAACRPWLDAELEAVSPRGLMALGATAAQGLFGPAFRVTRERGRPVESDLAEVAMATVHPSSILRADEESRPGEYEAFVADLRALATALRTS
jgi:uracil-DNA glycosylase family protein